MKTLRTATVATALLLPLAHALAGPADYVFTPVVEEGEREIEFKFGSAGKKAQPTESAFSVAYGAGVNAWWFTEIYAQWKNEAFDHGRKTRYDAIEWENRFQLTETGRYPVDLGFVVEIERPRDRAEGWEVKYGPLLQSEFGKLQINANLLFERSFHAEEPSQLVMSYQLQGKYRYRPELEFGVQALGEVGKWNRWERAAEQSLVVGPALFGKLRVGDHRAVKYNVAYLVGTTSHSPDRTFRTQIELEF